MKDKMGCFSSFVALLFLGSFLVFSLPVPCVAASYPFLKLVTRKFYPNTHAVLAKEIEELRFKKDGTNVDMDEVFLTILDEKGKRSEKVQSFYINRYYEKLDIWVMEIIKRDGRILPVDLKTNSREETPLADTEANIYDPKQKVLKVFLPNLSVGDTIHYKVQRVTFKTIIPNQLYGMILAQYTFPVRQYTFIMKGPADVKLHTLIKDKVKGCLTHKRWVKDRTQIQRWIFRNVPQITPEPFMPSFVRVAMRLLYSTLSSWRDASRWYASLVEPQLSPTPAIIAKVKALTKGLSSDEAKMRAIFYFVAQKIRYMGIIAEKKSPGFEPHAVGLTFSRRYGVCRDKAALLVAMLRVAGFRANMVLVNVGSKLDREIAVPYFNHAVAVVRDENGEPLIFMDPTSETSKQFFPDYERDSSCLIADKWGETLRVTPVLPPEHNLFQVVIRDIFSDDGKLYGEVEAVSSGFVDTAFRYLLMTKSREERDEQLRRMMKARYPGIEITHLTWTNPADRSRPFSFSFNFHVLHTSVSGREGVLFFIPLSNMENPGVLDRWILGKADMVNRRYPLRFGYTYMTRVIETVHLRRPPVEITLPAIRNVVSDVMDYQTTFSIKGRDTLCIRREFALKKLEVSPGEYRQVTEIQHDRGQRVTLPIILRKNP